MSVSVPEPPVPRGRHLATVAALLALAAALSFGWRYVQLGRLVATNRAALTASLRPPVGESVGEVSGRVASTVERNEALVDRTLVMGAAQRTAGCLCLASGIVALVAGSRAVASRSRRSHR
jgi:hypothetical protein